MISFLRRLLARQPSELEQMRRNRDYWREAAIAATEQIECQRENVGEGLRMVAGLRADVAKLQWRLAARCVGYEPHPIPAFADDFCAAPIYVGDRPQLCGMPRNAHRSTP